MKNTIQILTLVLAVQVVVAVVSFTTGPSLEPFTSEEELLNLSLDQLSEIQITPSEDKQDEAITLVKKEGTWTLKNYYDFPAAMQKVKNIGEKLLSVKKPYPVGSTAVAAKQFEVSDKNFKTKVEFKKDDTVLETLYLGSSPTFKKAHARLGTNMTTYAIPFSAYEIQGKPSTWIDRDYLKQPYDSVKKVTFGDFSLIHENDDPQQSFTVESLGEDEAVNREKIEQFLKAALQQGFLDVLGKEDKKEYNLKRPVFTLTVEMTDGSTVENLFGQIKDEKYFILKPSNEPYYFKVSSYQGEKISKVKRADLVQPKAAESAAESNEADPATDPTTAESNTEETPS